MPNAKDKLKLDLIHPSFPGNSEKKRVKSRDNKKMEDSGNICSPSPSIGNSDENTDAGMDISPSDKRQKYVRKTKANVVEQQEADATPFTQWMISLDQNPKDHQVWKNEYNTRCSPMLEEIEVTMQSSIDVLSTFNQEKIQLATNHTTATAITLEKKSANHVIKVTYMRNSSIPKTCYEFR